MLQRPSRMSGSTVCDMLMPGGEHLSSKSTRPDVYASFENHHQSSASLNYAAKNGCYVCQPFWGFVPKIGCGSDDEVPVCKMRYSSIHSEEKNLISVVMIFEVDTSGTGATKYNPIYHLHGHPWICHYPGVRGKLSQMPLEECISTAQGWLDECLTNHSKCRRNIGPSFYPTRLLEVCESTIRLIHPAE